MPERDLAKTYDPHAVEAKWYDLWTQRGYFRLPPAADQPQAPAYCITIPPPNVTGSLHIGHALQHSIHDTIARWRRMSGDRVLVVPGTDHAAISTNMKVEQALAEQDISRHDIGRDAFVERCWDWTRKYGGQIIDQLKALGCSYDWDRTRFTLDDAYYRAVLRAFVLLHERGWIYRGHRVVNWCPACASTVSDLEVRHTDHHGNLWHIRYPLADGDGHVVVATTRPETMLGDTAVAVHSEDQRYLDLHGKQVMLPLMNRPLPVICDDILVDPEFGTGAVKVTPAHDLNDFDAGQRNDLDSVVVIGTDGRMTEHAGPYAGLDRYQARQRIVADLEAQGLLVKTEDYAYPVGRHDRCDTVLEPLLSEQWFLKMADLAEMALGAIRDENIQVPYSPDRFRRYTIDWLNNLRDWNISRQIWWGHRIPVYTCSSCHRVIVQADEPPSCDQCGGPLQQDPDTLDTWFSSALWPFAVLGWPDQDQFKQACDDGVYPTALMITARDILYLWIVRMIMTSLQFTDLIPFRQVLVHPTVLDVEGRRMSKSLGTGIDPLELISKYGADATRFSLLYQCAADQDVRFGEERTETARNFCNKIWNASRFLLANLGEDFSPSDNLPQLIRQEGSLAERWILSRCTAMLQTVDDALANFEMSNAARALYDFFWSEFCDWFLEISKPALRAGGPPAHRARQTLWFILECTLRALHPFMPFITEELWHQLPDSGETLMHAPWPHPDPAARDQAAERDMDAFMQVVVAARKLRAEHNVPQSNRVPITLSCASDSVRRLLADNQQAALLLARGSALHLSLDTTTRPAVAEAVRCCGEPATVSIDTQASQQDIEQHQQRLTRDLARLQQEESVLKTKLDNPQFRNRAPAEIVDKTLARYAEAQQTRKEIEAQLADLRRSLER